jgi:hypothetical protein
MHYLYQKDERALLGNFKSWKYSFLPLHIFYILPLPFYRRIYSLFTCHFCDGKFNNDCFLIMLRTWHDVTFLAANVIPNSKDSKQHFNLSVFSAESNLTTSFSSNYESLGTTDPCYMYWTDERTRGRG